MDQGRAIRQIFGEPGGKQGSQDTGAQGEAAQGHGQSRRQPPGGRRRADGVDGGSGQKPYPQPRQPQAVDPGHGTAPSAQNADRHGSRPIGWILPGQQAGKQKLSAEGKDQKGPKPAGIYPGCHLIIQLPVRKAPG